MIRTFLSVLLCSIMFGCVDKTQSDMIGQKFKLDDFKEVALGRGERLTDDPEILGVSKEIRVVSDSVIAISKLRSPISIAMYNIRKNSYKNVIRKGIGPDEILNVTSMSRDGAGNVWLAGYGDRKVVKANWDSQEENRATIEIMPSPEDELYKAVTDSRGGLIGLPTFFRESRVLLIDSCGFAIDSLGSFPKIEMADSIKPTNLIFQADLAYSPKVNKIVLSNKSVNEINIYSPEDKETKKLIGPVQAEIAVKSNDAGFGYVMSLTPLWLMFSGVTASDDCFAVGYIGVEIKNQDDFQRESNSILEFDWDGRPLRRFVPENEFVAFDIDFENGYLYTIENRPEPELIRYKLKR